jgi:DNA repair protein RecO (recombination protein O)
MSIHKAEALVLRRMDFRETSFIVTFFTRTYGKVSGVLKGIRTDPRKFASTVEIFSHNDIVFYRSRSSSLHLVSQCDARACFGRTRTDLLRTATATLMMELVNTVMPVEDRNDEVFDLAVHSLHELESEACPEKTLTVFKIKLLGLSGFKPHFDACVVCGRRIHTEVRFSLAQGGLVCGNCLHRDPRARPILRGTVASLLHIQRNELRRAIALGLAPQVREELDMVLTAFLVFHLERDFKAQRVLNSLHATVGREVSA